MPLKHARLTIRRPNVEFLRESGRLLLSAEDMSKFLQVPRAVMQRLTRSGRIPPPLHLGVGKVARWSVFDLLEWIAAGCPCRSQ